MQQQQSALITEIEAQKSPIEDQTAAVEALNSSAKVLMPRNRAERRFIEGQKRKADRRSFKAQVREFKQFPPTANGYRHTDFEDCMYRLSLLMGKSVEDTTAEFKKMAAKFPNQSWKATYRGLLAYVGY